MLASLKVIERKKKQVQSTPRLVGNFDTQKGKDISVLRKSAWFIEWVRELEI